VPSKETIIVRYDIPRETWEDFQVLCHLEGWFQEDALTAAIKHWVAYMKEQIHKEQQEHQQLLRRERREDI
jgi:hypothetical protein